MPIFQILLLFCLNGILKAFECANGEITTFLRHQRLYVNEEINVKIKANFVKRMNSIEECADLCLNNLNSVDINNKFICNGFTFYLKNNKIKNNSKEEIGKNICEFFDENKSEVLERKPLLIENTNFKRNNISRNYFEKICLSSRNGDLVRINLD
uniref:Apple domain-containing protein n=1 Tax=Meloidogyne enterolobii TaxID=390850 RepID=A0A6V7VCC5_MELEN|nr:unnamed protein product [Meloidogyne enterolobii]